MKICEYELNLTTALFSLCLTRFPIEEIEIKRDMVYRFIYNEYVPSNNEITKIFKLYRKYLPLNCLYISRTISADETHMPVIDILLLEIDTSPMSYIRYG